MKLFRGSEKSRTSEPSYLTAAPSPCFLEMYEVLLVCTKSFIVDKQHSPKGNPFSHLGAARPVFTS